MLCAERSWEHGHRQEFRECLSSLRKLLQEETRKARAAKAECEAAERTLAATKQEVVQRKEALKAKMEAKPLMCESKTTERERAPGRWLRLDGGPRGRGR